MADEQHLAALKRSPQDWNNLATELGLSSRFKGGGDFSGADLTSVDCRGANLNFANFSGTRLVDVNFSGAGLVSARFYGSTAQRCDFRSSGLVETLFVGAEITGARFADTVLHECLFDRCLMPDTDFDSSKLVRCRFIRCDMQRAKLRAVKANDNYFMEASLGEANLSQATLRGSALVGADLTDATLEAADLMWVNLERAQLVRTNLRNANLTSVLVYGVSVWDPVLDGATQSDLRVGQLVVDSLELAQFVNVVSQTQKLSFVIDALTNKIVLLLGRFTPERRQVLDALKNALREKNLVPVIFDFEAPASRDSTETVSALAHVSRYVIADITEPRSVIQELNRIVPALPSVPVIPIIEASDEPWSMFDNLARMASVLPPIEYDSTDTLIQSLERSILEPAERKLQELRSGYGSSARSTT